MRRNGGQECGRSGREVGLRREGRGRADGVKFTGKLGAGTRDGEEKEKRVNGVWGGEEW